MPVDKLIIADNFINFKNSVRDFCDLLENNATHDFILFLTLTQIHLQTLYSSAQQLQSVDLTHDENFANLLTKEQSQKILNNLLEKLDKNRFYWHVFDPAKAEETEPVCGDLVDDIGDIYKDLKNAILRFHKGATAEIEDAVWSFKESFDNHWGRHRINAIYALHYLIHPTT